MLEDGGWRGALSEDIWREHLAFYLSLIRISFLALWRINPNIADGYYSGDCEDAKRECSQSRVGHFQIFYFIS